MSTVRDPNDHVWSGSHQFNGPQFSFPDASVGDANIPIGANINDGKLMHRHDLKSIQPSTIVAATESLLIAYRAGTVADVSAAVDTPATGADRTVTIDIQKSTGGAAFASILTTPLVLNSATPARTAQHAALSGTPTIAEGDILQIVVNVAGVAAAQAAGLIVFGTAIENGV